MVAANAAEGKPSGRMGAMAIAGKAVEKPGGARDVVSWSLHLARQFPRYPGDIRTARYTVEFQIDFDSEDAAEELEAKIRALLPEVKP